eukprot:Sdes_comp17433_c0_seq1m6656
MPPVDNKFDPTLANQALKLSSRWREFSQETSKTGLDAKACFTNQDISSMSALQVVSFFEDLLKSPGKLPKSVAENMDTVYSLSSIKNNEIKFVWQTLALRSGYDKILPHVVEFLASQGRMKYVRSLYRDLQSFSGDRNLAKDTFLKYRKTYHPIAASLIAKDIKVAMPIS